MAAMKSLSVFAVTLLLLTGAAFAQKDADDGPTSTLNFLILKDDSGKPVRNASVIMHPVSDSGKQERGGLELKTDLDGKSNSDGIPYGKLRVQVLASGFQTYGDDFVVDRPKMDFTIRLKRPQGQYSIYNDHSKDPNAQPKPNAPPPDNKSDKPN
jgi:hypothetical protein